MINKMNVVLCSLLLATMLNGAEQRVTSMSCLTGKTSICYAFVIPYRNSAVAVWYDKTNGTYNGSEVKAPTSNNITTNAISSKKAQTIYAVAEDYWKIQQQAIVDQHKLNNR